MKRLVAFWTDVSKGWSEDKASMFAAALALFMVLSLGPLLLSGMATAVLGGNRA